MSNVISRLRDVVPIRPLTQAEGLRVAEQQAAKLLFLSEVDRPPVPESIITELPRIQVERMTPSPAHGATQWSRGRWLIVINGADALGRQRFSLAHEFKHILDNPFISILYPDLRQRSHRDRAEHVCDHFAACLLMPRPWVNSIWSSGMHDMRRLARLFNVSQEAMEVRLLQVGLIEPPGRYWLAA
jgi:Zn-dependent peptidase ImmA (M78 family)